MFVYYLAGKCIWQYFTLVWFTECCVKLSVRLNVSKHPSHVYNFTPLSTPRRPLDLDYHVPYWNCNLKHSSIMFYFKNTSVVLSHSYVTWFLNVDLLTFDLNSDPSGDTLFWVASLFCDQWTLDNVYQPAWLKCGGGEGVQLTLYWEPGYYGSWWLSGIFWLVLVLLTL